MIRKNFLMLLLAFAGLLAMSGYGLGVFASSQNQVVKAPPDDEEAQERRAFARRAVSENCTICHAPDLIEAQRLTPKQWKAEVEKMIGWGSPLPAEQAATVIDYLGAEYPVDAKPLVEQKLSVAEAFDRIAPEPFLAGRLKGDAARGETLHIKNCANCHARDGQGADLGPNLVERPVLLRPSEFAEVIRKGRGRMPSFAATLDAQTEADMLAWLQERRYVTTSPK
jgi:mono/diheme cytochrome c family protein